MCDIHAVSRDGQIWIDRAKLLGQCLGLGLSKVTDAITLPVEIARLYDIEIYQMQVTNPSACKSKSNVRAKTAKSCDTDPCCLNPFKDTGGMSGCHHRLQDILWWKNALFNHGDGITIGKRQVRRGLKTV